MAQRRILMARRLAHRGFSLVELMVAVTIGLVVTLVIFNVLQTSEARKRTTTGINDINQSGAYSAYILDRSIRTAGSGFTNQLAPSGLPLGIEGCRLSIQLGGATPLILAPAPSAYPAPFAGVAQTPVIAPVIIDQGADSDVITVMSGASGIAEAGARTSVPTPVISTVGVSSTVALRVNDLVLFARDAAAATPCVVSQVASVTAPSVLTLGGAFTTATPANGIEEGDLALSIGNPTTNPPQMRMYGVDASQQLVSYDLLRLGGAAFADVTPVAEGVIAMRAIYGIDNAPAGGDNIVDQWIDPAGANWSGAALRNGTAASSERIRQIVAVRVALVLRTATAERDAIQASRSFNLYTDLPTGSPTRTISFAATGDDRFRYRVIETTVPVRNNLL